MKKTAFCAFAAFAAASAGATVVSSNTLCWIAVNSSLTNVIVSTPLVNIGLPAGSTVDLTNLVSTVNLKQGDMILKKVPNTAVDYDAWHWKGWRLDSDGGSWVPVTTTVGNSSEGPGDAEVSWANAFKLYRTDPDKSNPFYIGGQLETTAARKQTADDAVTLMSNASLQDIYIENIPFVKEDGKGPVRGDKISLISDEDGVGADTYTYDGASWCLDVVTTVNNTPWGSTTKHTLSPVVERTVIIPVGQGFLFRKVGSTASTIIWSDPTNEL